MKRLQYLFLCVTLLIFVNNGMAQSIRFISPSMEIFETVFDNRSIAMGKTAVTTANSSSAIFSNPSILGTFADSQAQLGGKLFYGTITNEPPSGIDTDVSYEARYLPFPNRSYASFAIPYEYDDQLKVVFGIGYQRNEGIRAESESTWTVDEWSEQRGDFVKAQKTETTTQWSRGGLSTVTPGIALNVQDRFYFGATFNRTFGAILGTQEIKRTDQQEKSESELEQSALFLKIGALAEITPELAVGFTYRPEFDWEFREEIIKKYTNGELDYTDRDQTVVEFTIPNMWGIGVKYKVSPTLIVAAELQSRPYSDLEFGSLPFIDDGFNLSVGLEFLELDFPVRIGAFRDVLPYVDQNDTDPISLIGITAGIGSSTDQELSWNISMLFSRWEQTISDDGRKYSENIFRAGASATYHFQAF